VSPKPERSARTVQTSTGVRVAVLKSLDKLPLGRHPKSSRHSLVVPHGGCLERSADIEVRESF
jgi:hypothetical protein